MAKLDIIIPVYNAEKYIKKCMTSIINQEFQDWNAILVDDGSSDKSGKILDDLAQKDQRLKVIHTNNRGSIAARLEGVVRSTSEWIAFVDADDVIKSTLFSYLIEIAERNSCDIACCGHVIMSSQGHLTKKCTKDFSDAKELVRHGVDLAPEFHGLGTLNAGLWGKIYKRNLFSAQIHELEKLPNLFWGEDTMINSLVFEKANLVVISNAKLYCYRIGGGSSTFSDKRINELVRLYCWRRNYLEKYDDFKYKRANVAQILNAIVYYLSISNTVMSRNDICHELKEIINDMNDFLPYYKMRDAFDLNIPMTDQEFCSLYKERWIVKLKTLILKVL